MTALPVAARAVSSSAPAIVARGVAIAAAVALEIGLLDRAYSFRDLVAGAPTQTWLIVNDTLQAVAYAALIACAAFAMLAYAQQRSIAADWIAAARTHRWGRWLAAQTVLAAAVFAAVPLLQRPTGEAPWLGFALWLAGCTSMLACAALALAPSQFWRTLLARHVGNALVALFAGGFTYAAIDLARESWRGLSTATLFVSHWLLSLYEPDAYMDAGRRILGAGDFRVVIDAPCSGYEGVGLVVAALGFHLFAFRRDLRFPNALALLPLAAATMWLLNNVRLALLVSLGAHVSPAFALGGFHSQAGWILFISVAVAFMAAAQLAPAFQARPAPMRAADPALGQAAALLAPFAALMAAHALADASGLDAHWSAAAIVLPAAALWFCRDRIQREFKGIGAAPAFIGAAVGLLWIATAPGNDDSAGAWVADQPPAAFAAWLCLRMFGFVLIAPMAEELLFRGYLHRALISRRFESVAPGAFTWTAFIVTSLLFGAMHGRWLAGGLAGAAFAISLYRSKTLAGPITAHITANAVIAFYALAALRWDLL